MPEFSHSRPPEVFGKEGYHTHKIEVGGDKEKIGYIEFEYYNDPFPFYYVSFLSVKSEKRGEGFGSALLEKINEFLDTKSRTGFLVNTISPDNPAKPMYEKHGWVPVSGKSGWFAYNLPDDLEEGRLEKAIYKIKSNNIS